MDITIEWNPMMGSGWMIHSFYQTVEEARIMLEELLHSPGYDHDATHWRIMTE